MNSTSCVFCNTDDHASTKCPLICKLCQNWGHRTISCPLLICKHCKQQGHIRTKCPLLKEQFIKTFHSTFKILFHFFNDLKDAL